MKGKLNLKDRKKKNSGRKMKLNQIRILSKIFGSYRNSECLFQLSIFFRSVVFYIETKTSSIKFSLH